MPATDICWQHISGNQIQLSTGNIFKQYTDSIRILPTALAGVDPSAAFVVTCKCSLVRHTWDGAICAPTSAETAAVATARGAKQAASYSSPVKLNKLLKLSSKGAYKICI